MAKKIDNDQFELHEKYGKHNFRGGNNRKRCSCGLWEEHSLSLALSNEPMESMNVAFDMYNNMDVCVPELRFRVLTMIRRKGIPVLDWYKANMHKPYANSLLVELLNETEMNTKDCLVSFKLFNGVVNIDNGNVGGSYRSNVLRIITHFMQDYDKNLEKLKLAFGLTLNNENLFADVHGYLTDEMKRYLTTLVTKETNNETILYLIEQTGITSIAQHVNGSNSWNGTSEILRKAFLLTRHASNVQGILADDEDPDEDVSSSSGYGGRDSKPNSKKRLHELIIDVTKSAKQEYSYAHCEYEIERWLGDRLHEIIRKGAAPANVSRIAARMYKLMLKYKAGADDYVHNLKKQMKKEKEAKEAAKLKGIKI